MKAAALVKLAVLREAIMQGAPVQSFVADWWQGLLPDDRRTLLAFCGQDDTPETARRPWAQYLPEVRAAIVAECKRLHRITDPMRWA